MYFLDLDDDRIDDFKQGWGKIGDSIVVVGGDGLWNCHVHTNDIGASIEVALELDGRPKQIRVTDLFEEVADEQTHREHDAREAALAAGTQAAPAHLAPRAGAGLPPVTTAVVAVCSGDASGRCPGCPPPHDRAGSRGCPVHFSNADRGALDMRPGIRERRIGKLSGKNIKKRHFLQLSG
jgi:hypothetical protein